MDEAESLDDISERLRQIRFEPWGPDGVRYLCILFWNELGYRMLYNRFNSRAWTQWSKSSGDFWDLHLAGCHGYKDEPPNGRRSSRGETQSLPLATGWTKRRAIYWNYDSAMRFADEVASVASRAGVTPGWRFEGPIELVVIGARRPHSTGIPFDSPPAAGCTIEYAHELDWASMRTKQFTAAELPDAVSYYTEAHVLHDADVIPDNLPKPGDFVDSLPGEIRRDFKKLIGPLAGLLFRAGT
ncbi:hypothetical protein [Nocardia iowensis]|uniref:Uncharacterized protein n=1 Tax=Nocardia iowensis TaxID=204891 RepID=A0ABX8RHX8_NOCIO|nr:hypothetical protein [Nocardia iowensis]QXN88487.1 hypothetical protein KV110_23100 [Nocardia iowensis]